MYLYDPAVAQSGLQGEIWRHEAGKGFAKEQNAKPGWSLGKGEQIMHSVGTEVRAVINYYNSGDLHTAWDVVDAQ